MGIQGNDRQGTSQGVGRGCGFGIRTVHFFVFGNYQTGFPAKFVMDKNGQKENGSMKIEIQQCSLLMFF